MFMNVIFQRGIFKYISLSSVSLTSGFPDMCFTKMCDTKKINFKTDSYIIYAAMSVIINIFVLYIMCT